MSVRLLCSPPEGLEFNSWYDAYLLCANSCENLSPPNNRYCFSSCSGAVFPCVQYEEISSSSSEECTNDGFNPDNVLRGFTDYNDIFVIIFACFILVKLVNMAK